MSTTDGARVLLHIGLEKTGTTLIQEVLLRAEPDLALHNWQTGAFLGAANHQALVSACADVDHLTGLVPLSQSAPHEQVDQIRALLGQHLPRTAHTLFSSEQMSSRLVADTAVRRLLAIFDGLTQRVDIIMFVRRQDRMAESSYATRVLSGDPAWPSLEKEASETTRYDFAATVSLWEQATGTPARVRLYEEGISEYGLLRRFCESAGLPGPFARWLIGARVNVSPDVATLARMRYLNELVAGNEIDGVLAQRM